MAARKDVSKVDPVLIGLTEEADLSRAMLIDHLSPRMQELYAEAKGFQARYKFDFCWTRNGSIFLRRDAEARPVKIKSSRELARLAQNEQEMLT